MKIHHEECDLGEDCSCDAGLSADREWIMDELARIRADAEALCVHIRSLERDVAAALDGSR